jgi:hypothetical protein
LAALASGFESFVAAGSNDCGFGLFLVRAPRWRRCVRQIDQPGVRQTKMVPAIPVDDRIK